MFLSTIMVEEMRTGQTYEHSEGFYKHRSICSFLDIGRQEDFRWNFAICSGHFFTFHYCGNSMGSAASHHIVHQNNCKFSIHSILVHFHISKLFSICRISDITFTSLVFKWKKVSNTTKVVEVNIHSSFKINQNYAVPMVVVLSGFGTCLQRF